MVLTLERYARWRYRWFRGRSVKLGGDGMATFELPARTRTYVRVALRPRGGHGPALVGATCCARRTAVPPGIPT